jgi:hypothetical protein
MEKDARPQREFVQLYLGWLELALEIEQLNQAEGRDNTYTPENLAENIKRTHAVLKMTFPVSKATMETLIQYNGATDHSLSRSNTAVEGFPIYHL